MAILLTLAGVGHGQVVDVGEYKCWTPSDIMSGSDGDSKEAAALVSGYCKYQAKGINGKTAFGQLDEIPRRIIRRNAPNIVSYMEPMGNSGDYTITWWIEGDNPDEIHPANHVIGRQLQLADVRYPLTRIPIVEIRAMVFTLDQTKEREIGLDIAANFASAPGADATAPPSTAAITATATHARAGRRPISTFTAFTRSSPTSAAGRPAGRPPRRRHTSFHLQPS